MKPLKAQKIGHGTVIDHIDAGDAWKVVQLLGLAESKGTVFLLSNIDSKTYGKKDIVKIENREICKDEVDKIALVAPHATVNIIRDYEVKKKFSVAIPDVIEGILRCTNPNCVTNKEPVAGRFVVQNKNPLTIRCYFCERVQRGLEFV